MGPQNKKFEKAWSR